MSNLPALYELASEYVSAADKLQDIGLDEQTVADTLESLSGDLEVKCQNVAMVIRNMESMAEQIKKAEEAMASRRKAIESRAESVRQYLLTNMQRCQISEIESPWFKIALRNNPPKVMIGDPSLIPQLYMRQPPIPALEPDKKAISDALKQGVKVGDCYLEQSQTVVIK